MASAAPVIEVESEEYQAEALVTGNGWVILRPVTIPDPASETAAACAEQIASIEIVTKQLTILPGYVWALSGFIGALVLQPIVSAVQYMFGRRARTVFTMTLQDGRRLTARADEIIIRIIQRGMGSATTAAG